MADSARVRSIAHVLGRARYMGGMWHILPLITACSALTAPAPAPEPPAPAPAPAPAPPPEPAPEPEPTPDLGAHQNAPPEGWTDLRDVLPDARFDIRYHTADNFTGAPLPGYGVPGAWLRDEPAQALVKVQARLAEQGRSLLIYDAYRPLRGTLGMVAWARRTDQVALLDGGYIARRSGHNKGNTVDLSVFDVATGEELDMGTAWDTLSEESHTRRATGEALDNRMLLREVMHAEGFKNYFREWWHYTWGSDKGLPYRDVPYACFEPDEGAWTAPEGWEDPGHTMPDEHDVTDCR